MFDQFHSAFQLTSRIESPPVADLLSKLEPYAVGLTELLGRCGGSTFDNGVYRLHNSDQILKWTKNVETALPAYKGRTVCFAFDWLGRHFALDKGRVENQQMQIFLLEPGAGEAMQIPATFRDFHNAELVECRNDALASDFFAQWLKFGGQAPEHDQCVGYKIPLFLSGSDTIDNLEVSDMDVYWSICGQVLNAKPK